MNALSRLSREPLVHFFALGALLFALHGLRAASPVNPARIVVTRAQIEQLATIFERTWQRPPTAVELDGLVEDWIRTEVAVRQARALGLDEQDTVIRRRLRQKLEFITEDVARTTPGDDELRRYLTAHPDAFRTPPRFTFTQIYLSSERHADPVADARVLLARLDAPSDGLDTSTLGDPLLAPGELVDAPRPQVAGVFGDTFAAALESVPIGRWAGPIDSGYGVHLVLLRERIEGAIPPLDEIRTAVEREWQNARRIEVLDEVYRRLRDRYEIVIDRPHDAPGLPSTR